jgi:hypothetical protein
VEIKVPTNCTGGPQGFIESEIKLHSSRLSPESSEDRAGTALPTRRARRKLCCSSSYRIPSGRRQVKRKNARVRSVIPLPRKGIENGWRLAYSTALTQKLAQTVELAHSY